MKRNYVNCVGLPGVRRRTLGDGFSTPLFSQLDRNFKPAGSEKQHDSHQSRRRAESGEKKRFQQSASTHSVAGENETLNIDVVGIKR